MKTFVDGEILTASDLNANFQEAGTQRVIVGAAQSLPGGTSATLPISFGVSYPVPPVVCPAFAAGSEAFKGTVTVQDISSTGCTLRLDNIGTSLSKITPACVVIPR